ncbi:hypothetical protein ACFFRR_006248 [Megaselia abdita]
MQTFIPEQYLIKDDYEIENNIRSLPEKIVELRIINSGPTQKLFQHLRNFNKFKKLILCECQLFEEISDSYVKYDLEFFEFSKNSGCDLKFVETMIKTNAKTLKHLKLEWESSEAERYEKFLYGFSEPLPNLETLILYSESDLETPKFIGELSKLKYLALSVPGVKKGELKNFENLSILSLKDEARFYEEYKGYDQEKVDLISTEIIKLDLVNSRVELKWIKDLKRLKHLSLISCELQSTFFMKLEDFVVGLEYLEVREYDGSLEIIIQKLLNANKDTLKYLNISLSNLSSLIDLKLPKLEKFSITSKLYYKNDIASLLSFLENNQQIEKFDYRKSSYFEVDEHFSKTKLMELADNMGS